jgi:hypothetical protein
MGLKKLVYEMSKYWVYKLDQEEELHRRRHGLDRIQKRR